MVNGGKNPLPVALLLLGGGIGSRIGGNKLFLAADGEPLLERLLARMTPFFSQTVLSVGVGETEKIRAAMPGLEASYNLKIAEDRAAGRGPLEGLSRTLDAAACEWGFLYACDMPSPQEAVIRAQWGGTDPQNDVSAVRLDGHVLALHAFYKKTCLPYIEEAFAQKTAQKKRGGPRIVSFYDKIRAQVADESQFAYLPGYRKSFENYNTKQELEHLLTDF